MKTRILWIVSVAVIFIFIVLLFKSYNLYKENSLLEKEVVQLNVEKMKSLVDLENCLKQNEQFLKKELIDKYADSMINLRNKIEKGYIPDDAEISNFFDRTEFIVSNLELLELPKEKAAQYIYFIESMRNLLKPFSATEDKNKETAIDKQ
ncbi:MAG TPA: hypothetical protein ENN58_02960 [bacterium]|nr:hypothetical protein [bacterium]